jgi:hypothetical protein
MSDQASTTLSRESLNDEMANTREEKEKHNDIEGTLKGWAESEKKTRTICPGIMGVYVAPVPFTTLPLMSPNRSQDISARALRSRYTEKETMSR